MTTELQQRAGAMMKRLYDGETLNISSDRFTGSIHMVGAGVQFPDDVRDIGYTKLFLEVALLNGYDMEFQRVY